MSSAAPGNFFKRKGPAQSQVKQIRRFSDVDTDSDFEIDEEKRSRPSPPSLSFKTEATEKVPDNDVHGKSGTSKNLEVTSEGSILFESGSERESSPAASGALHAAAASSTATAATTATKPPQPQQLPAAGFAPTQPQTLAEKLFGSIDISKKPVSPSQQQHPPMPAPSPRPTDEALQVKKAPAEPPASKSAVAPVPLPSPVLPSPQPSTAPKVAAHSSTPPATVPAAPAAAPAVPAPAAMPGPNAQKKHDQQQKRVVSPPTATLTAEYDGHGLMSKEHSVLPEDTDNEEDEDQESDGGFAERVLPMSRGRQQARQAESKEAAARQSSSQPTYITPLREQGFAEDARSVVASGTRAMLPPTMHRDASDELLVRARLRLEEKRKNDAAAAIASRAATPKRQGNGVGSAARDAGLLQSGNRGVSTPSGTHYYLPTTPSPADGTPGFLSAGAAGGYRGMAPTAWGNGLQPHQVRTAAGAAESAVSPHMVEAKLRRLSQENTRLQDEVTFLNRENLKLRSVAGSVDSAENIKMQLTIDMLRKELQSKELDHQGALRDSDAEKASLANQIAELQDQNEGYTASAAQYRNLYEEKVREVEQAKMQLQRLAQDMQAVEHRQENDSYQHQSELAAEREKVDKLLYLIDDIKKQRQHLHELNQQLQLELVTVNDEKAHLKESLQSAEDRARQAKSVHEQTLQTAQQDVTRLKEALADKDRHHAAALREEQRLGVGLQKRLDEAVAAAQDETARLRRSADSIREEGKRALADEKERRVGLEEKLRRVEAEFKASLASFKDSASAEHDRRIKALREDLTLERGAREAAQLDAERFAQEADRLRETVAYQAAQHQALAADFGHSEEMRDKAERQSDQLSSTLQEMMQQDEQQGRRVAQLELVVGQLRQQLDQLGFSPFSGNWSTENASDTASPRTANAGSLAAQQLELLSSENERLTNECVRLAGERDTLIDENGKIAEELLRWKNEMQVFVSSQLKQQQRSM